MLTVLDCNTVVNLDAIAAVFFSETDGGLSATVKFLGRDRIQSGDVFSGEAAEKLRKLITGDGTEGAFSASDGVPSIPFVPNFNRTKAWYHFADSDGRRYFMAYVNAKGSCSMRTFDADTGVFLSKKSRPGNYQSEFADYTKNGTGLTVYSQPNLERDCKERLPESVLNYLKKQLK